MGKLYRITDVHPCDAWYTYWEKIGKPKLLIEVSNIKRNIHKSILSYISCVGEIKDAGEIWKPNKIVTFYAIKVEEENKFLSLMKKSLKKQRKK
jgi:hypothetical protein